MNKASRLIKRYIALLLVLLFSIESFAAVVGDNDGAAFITKAEFDSLKNDFQSQLDRYNSSIDNKIDGAIAAYLAGIKVVSKSLIKTNLDANGKLSNGKRLLWNSDDDSYFGDTSGHRYVYETIEFAQMYKIGQNGNRYVYAYFFENVNNHDGTDWSKAKRNYLTSYKTKLTLNDGTKVDGYKRTRVMSRLVWSYIEVVPYYNIESNMINGFNNDSGATSSAISGNMSKIKQQTANLFTKNIGGTGGGQWWSYTNVNIFNDDNGLDDSDDYETLYPNSEAEEYYWDKEDTTSTIARTKTNYVCKWNWGVRNPWGVSGINDRNFKDDAAGLGMNMYGMYEANWLKKKVKVNEQYLETLNSVDTRHRQVKNGFIIANTQGTGNYSLKVNVTEPGKLYVHVGNSAVSNWTAADFDGLSFDLSSKDTDYTCQLGELTSTDVPIWICYLPTDTSKTANLKIKECYLES